MIIAEQGHEILYPNIHNPFIAENLIKRIEAAGRTCYKSENKITPGSATKFVRMILKRGHESVLEHESIQVRFITDRGVTHELVRHRIGVAYSHESTRYCDYSKITEEILEDELTCQTGAQIQFIQPVDFVLDDDDLDIIRQIESHYFKCIEKGRSPQQARYFLINGLKTEIVMTANIRAWRHIFGLRCSPKAHPQMQALMIPLLNDFNHCLPVLFQDLHQEYGGAYRGKDMI